ncbi:MAG: hypothetical protein ACLPRE_10915 [Limisphaerales bacterium]
MDNSVSFDSREYLLMLGLLVFGRGMDFLSTWIATPNLALEGNPLAKKLGWKWGLSLNAVLVVALAMWPLSAIVVTTASVLVAARNFQSAWLMRSLGEDAYREWHVQRVRETRVTLHLFCLAGNTSLTAVVGAALIYFSKPSVPFAIGMGMVAYAIAVAFYSLLAIWRIHQATKREARRLQALPHQQPEAEALVIETYSRPPD